MDKTVEKAFKAFQERMQTVYEKHTGESHHTWMDGNAFTDAALVGELGRAEGEIEIVLEIMEANEGIFDDTSIAVLREQMARQCIDVANWAMFVWFRMAGEDDGY